MSVFIVTFIYTIGFIVGVGWFIYDAKKSKRPTSEEEVVLAFFLAIFWPMVLAVVCIMYPVVKTLEAFLKWLNS